MQKCVGKHPPCIRVIQCLKEPQKNKGIRENQKGRIKAHFPLQKNIYTTEQKSLTYVRGVERLIVNTSTRQTTKQRYKYVNLNYRMNRTIREENLKIVSLLFAAFSCCY